MSDVASSEWRHMWGAKCKVPCDMDWDQLRKIIEKSQEVLKDLVPGTDPTADHASEIKKYCDELYGTSWHIVVGTNFGVHTIHDAKHFCFFYIGDIAVLATRTQ
mmetsp:Transcript_14411/g.23453  ORF Transcript_14411/g.23453 Transcript_14411/m.23453 type:complete len:104 (+) Transcript_14411:95-406(+)